MKTKAIAGIAALVIGLGLLGASLLADVIGIGSPSFGAQQTAGTIVGVIVTVTGVGLLRRVT